MLGDELNLPSHSVELHVIGRVTLRYEFEDLIRLVMRVQQPEKSGDGVHGIFQLRWRQYP